MTDNNAADSVLHNISAQQNYARRRYGYNRNSHWWGKAHRARLVTTGEYIKTSEQPRFTLSWTTTVEDGPGVFQQRDGRVLHHPTSSLACFNRHYLCSGATYTHHGWVTCQCDCHKENP